MGITGNLELIQLIEAVLGLILLLLLLLLLRKHLASIWIAFGLKLLGSHVSIHEPHKKMKNAYELFCTVHITI